MSEHSPGTPFGTSRPRAGQVTCFGCAFWDAGEPSEWQASKRLLYGTCRLHPPGTDGQGVTVWPSTESREWCGQHLVDWEAEALDNVVGLVISGEADVALRPAEECDHPEEFWSRRTVGCLKCGGVVPGVVTDEWGKFRQLGNVNDPPPPSQPHWHIVQNVAQRLGARRSSEHSAMWDVPAFGKIGITAAELVALDSVSTERRPSREMDVEDFTAMGGESPVVHQSPQVQAAARKLGATPAGWPVKGGKMVATLWSVPGRAQHVGNVDLIDLAEDGGTVQ